MFNIQTYFTPNNVLQTSEKWIKMKNIREINKRNVFQFVARFKTNRSLTSIYRPRRRNTLPRILKLAAVNPTRYTVFIA